ncbi:MAG: ATP-grasp domain-containing protein, partial [Oligoflexales bacterium]|nr:ATP-grasp domain-containing protein [Oligoflexales bacterium]
MKGKCLYFHIGCTYCKEELIKDLFEKGYSIVILDDIGNKPEINTYFAYHCIFQFDFNRIVKLITEIVSKKEFQEFQFFTLAEGSVDLLNKILKHFNRLPISILDAPLRDKYLNRKRMESFGEKLDVLEIATGTADIPIIEEKFFPLIVKPTDSMESRCVRKVANQKELQEACLDIFLKSKTYVDTDHGEIILEDAYCQSSHALIESCLKGQKISVEILVFQGKPIKYFVTKKFDYDNQFFYERADIAGVDFLNKKQKKSLEALIEKIISANGIVSSILHVELFFEEDSDHFHMIEINYRVGGGNIPLLIKKAYKVDIL